MRKVIHALAIPAALIIGLWLGTTIQKQETAFWHEMAYKISKNGEQSLEVSGLQLGVCLDVTEGNLTYDEGTAKMLELNEEMKAHTKEYGEITKEIESRYGEEAK